MPLITMPVFKANPPHSATLIKDEGNIFFIPPGETSIEHGKVDKLGCITVPEGSQILGITVRDSVTHLLKVQATLGTRIEILP